MKELIVQVPDDLARLFIETDGKKELVRCRNCKQFNAECDFCELTKTMCCGDDYCSYAVPANG